MSLPGKEEPLFISNSTRIGLTLNYNLLLKVDLMDDFNEICLPPSASDLLESMRALGYSFEAAVADLLDNSVSAQSSSIDIKFSPHDDPYVAILDDGTGMLPADLTAAMRHGSRIRTWRAVSTTGTVWPWP